VACQICENCSSGLCTAQPLLAAGARLYNAGLAFVDPLSAAVADVDGDGLPDVAVVQGNYYGPELDVFLGDGGGGFPSFLSFVSDQAGLTTVAAADLDGDGTRKLVVVTLGVGAVGSGFIVLSVDAGVLNMLTYVPTDPTVTSFGQADFGLYSNLFNPSGIAVGDLNGDGRDDVIILDPDGGPDVFFSLGGGSFDHLGALPGSFCGNAPGQWLGLAVGDLNGDGKNDIAASCADDSVGVWLQGPAGVFDNFELTHLTDPDPYRDLPRQLAIGNGCLNVMTYAGFSSLRVGDAGIELIATRDEIAGSTPMSIVTADLNGDGVCDVVLSVTYDDAVEIWLGHDGGFGAPATTYYGIAGTFGLFTALGDINLDGRADAVVVANGGTFGTSADGTAVMLNTCAP
jgi:hypothetical protein